MADSTSPTGGGPSDYQVEAETRGEMQQQQHGSDAGWANGAAALGNALAGNPAGQAPYQKGMLVGAQTIDALAQAKQRIQDNLSSLEAAKQIRTNGVAMGFKPEETEYLATQAEKGVPPEQIANSANTLQSMRMRATLGNAMAAPADREASAMALDPAGATPKPQGALGSVFQPLQPGAPNGLTGQTNVSPLQAQVSQTEAAAKQTSANAAATNANTRQDQGAVPKGYQVKLDPNTHEQVLDPSGRPQLEPIPGGPGDKSQNEGAINSRYHQVVLQAAAGLQRETENLSHMGLGTSRGATGFAGAGHGGIENTITDNLGKVLSSTDQQQYETTMTNVGRYLSMIENAGRMPPGSMTGQLDKAIKNGVGTTEGARLYNAATIRNIVEAGQDTISASAASQPVKDAYNKAVSSIQKSIPFSPSEVIDFEREGKPGEGITQFLARKNPQSGTPGANAPGAGHPADIQALISKYSGAKQ